MFQTPIHQNPEAFQAGECWEADHTCLDFFVRVQRGGKWTHDRPWLTCWMDRRSRRIVGWHIGFTPDSNAIRAAILNALHDEAVSDPRLRRDGQRQGLRVRSDRRTSCPASQHEQGRPRGVRAGMGGLLGQPGIEAHFNVPYNKDGKAASSGSCGPCTRRSTTPSFDSTGRSRSRFQTSTSADARPRDGPPDDRQGRREVRRVGRVVQPPRRSQHRRPVDSDGVTKISPAAFYESNLFRRSRLADPR